MMFILCSFYESLTHGVFYLVYVCLITYFGRLCQAASASMFSRLGGPVDSPSCLHDPKIPGSSLVSQPPPPPPPSQHQQQSVGPVNVVITSSDTLPTSAPVNQPTLSVTIPPHHLLGSPLVTQSTTNHISLQGTTSAFTSTTVSLV